MRYASVIVLSLLAICAYPQSSIKANSITLNNITYFYLNSDTTSSPIPDLSRASSIPTGNWYGEAAAKLWASISTWVIEHCTDSNNPVIPGKGEIVYITSIHSYKGNTAESKRYAIGATMNMGYPARDGITIYYWIVKEDEVFENGKKAYRSFAFSNW